MHVTQSSSAITPGQTAELYPGDIKSVLLTAEQIQARIAELGEQIGNDYRELSATTGQDLLLITVLKGAVLFVTDLARAIPVPTQFEFMAVSVRMGHRHPRRAWCGSSRTSTATSTAATC
ncbi:hypoxanthine-guanine phosphoribosyltransferase Hpt [Mycobacterium tuberculosis TKK_02_0020]|nr:hypoxanthine-guanine phosphoribosyltransferase Hpt [Mycobacterium tuberculosis TKK_02_0020]